MVAGHGTSRTAGTFAKGEHTQHCVLHRHYSGCLWPRSASYTTLPLRVYNSIELVRGKVKGCVAKHNKGFTLAEVGKLLPEALASVSQENWQNCCSHVEQVEAEAWERYMIVRDEMKPVVFSICDSCNSSSDRSSADFSEYLSGIEDLV